jgi:hypothetical protein
MVIPTFLEHSIRLTLASPQSDKWITKIKESELYINLQLKYREKRTSGIRPKIALIDTGYDPRAGFLKRSQACRNRLLPEHDCMDQQYHWKDFCDKNAAKPLDEDGHGTAMLSLLMELAPFADICVARIACKDSELRDDQSKSQKRLAEVSWKPLHIIKTFSY